MIHTSLQRLQRMQRDKLRHPRIAKLSHIRRRIASERSEQFLMRGGQRQLLQLDMDIWIFALELRQQLGDRLAFPADGPERQRVRIVGLLSTTC